MPPAGVVRGGGLRRGTLRRIAARLAFVAFGLVVALGGVEVALRIFGHEGPVYTIRDPVVGRRYTRSWEGDCWIEESERVVPLRFNREGMRDRDWPEARTAGRLRLAVLGDSMVAALGVEEQATFTRRLEALLPGPPDGGAEVMNWGVQGSSPALESVLYEVRVERYRPDLVWCVYFTGNDFSDDWQPIGGRRQGWGRVRADDTLEHEPFGGSAFSFTEWLARNSRLYVWQKRVLSRLHDPEPEGPRPGLRIFDTSADPELGRAWEFEEQLLGRFARRVAAAGGAFAVVLLPCADEVYDDLWETAVASGAERGWRLDRGHAGERLRALCRRAGVSLLDLTTAMREAARGRPSTEVEAQLYLRGTGHLNERGHEVVARAMATAPGLEPRRR